MKTAPQSWFSRIARWLPGTFDAADRAALVEMFETRAAVARDRSGLGRLLFHAREYSGLVWLLASAHAAALTRTPVLDHGARELRHAYRRLRRTPWMTASATAMMATAIGGAALVFALLSRVVLAPLPYPDSDRLIYLDHAAPGVNLETLGLSIGLYQQYSTLPSIEGVALYYNGVQTLIGVGDAVQVPFLHTTPSLGQVLRLRMALGRWFTDAEGRDGGADVVVLTDAWWRRVFHADARVIGRVISLDGRGYEVVGVLAPDSALPPGQAEFVVSLRLPASHPRAAGFNYEGIARLARGATVATARRDQDAVIADLEARFPGDRSIPQLVADYRMHSSARPLEDQVLGTAPQTLWILLAAAIAVLVVAGLNLATLFFVRAETRAAESALRQALGAHPVIDALGAAADPVLLTIAGGVIGLTAAHLGLGALTADATLHLPRADGVGIDLPVIAVAALTATLLGLVAGLAQPRRDRTLVSALDAGRRTIGSHRTSRTRTAVIGVQVAFATLLLIGAGLLIQSARHLATVNPGFQADQRLVFRLNLPRGIYRTRSDAEALHARLLDGLAGVSGISQAALTTTLPLDGEGIGNPIDVRGRATTQVHGLGVVRLRRVSTDYFDAMAMPIRRGRRFDTRDATNVVQAAVVNEAMAQRYFPNEDPIGREFRPAGADDRDGWLTIVGVVGNTVTYNLHEPEPIAQAFVPMRGPVRTDVPAVFSATYVVRTAQDPLAAVPMIRRVIASLDSSVPMIRPEPLAAVVHRSRARVMMMAVVLAIAAVAAVLLGLIGVYAVVAHHVAQRTAEIGVRMTFGADAGAVVRTVAGRSGVAIVAGAALGTALATAASRAIASIVYGVGARDTATYAVAAAAVTVLSLVACWIPARRATKMDPLAAIRRGA